MWLEFRRVLFRSRTIKKQKNNSEIPVIFVTAREDEKDKIAGLTSGADDYITKPFSHLELLARVEAVKAKVQELNSILSQ